MMQQTPIKNQHKLHAWAQTCIIQATWMPHVAQVPVVGPRRHEDEP